MSAESLIKIEFMTQPESDVDDLIGLACRQLSQQFDPVRPVWVRGEDDTLTSLQAILWSFQAHSFLPHLQLFDQAAVPEAHRGITPILLAAHEPQPFAYREIWNLAEDVWLPVATPDRPLRIVELVANLESLKIASRLRYKAYRQAGYQPIMTALE